MRAARHRIATAVTLAATLVVGAPAFAQRGWLPPPTDTVSAVAAGTADARVVVDAAGVVTAVWVEYAPLAFTVKAARRAPGAGWSAPAALSNPLTGADAALAATPGNGALAVWTADAGVFVARVTGVSGTWSPATAVSARPYAHAPHAAVDAAGNAIVLWYVDGSNRIEGVRYDVAADAWTAVFDLGSGWRPSLGMGATGTAVALWSDPESSPPTVKSASYSPATGLWSAPVILGTSDLIAPVTTLAVAADGTSLAAWVGVDADLVTRVHGAVRVGASGTWLAPVTLWSAPFSFLVPLPAAAIGRDHAHVAWTTPGGVFASRYDIGTGMGWSAPERIGAAERAVDVHIAADGLGGVVVVWQTGDGLSHGSRFDDAQSAAAVPTVLSLAGISASRPRVAVAPTGPATVVWSAAVGGLAAVQSTRWDATLSAPVITGVAPGAGSLTVAFQQPTDVTWPAFGAQNVEYSVNAGATWVTRAPASMSSPLVITGLTDLVQYSLRLRTVNAAGPGAAGAVQAAIPGVGSSAPSGLAVRAHRGGLVTLVWSPPVVGAVPEQYILDGGVVPGQTLVSIYTGSAVPMITLQVPPGVYYVRVRAAAALTTSGPSNDVRLVVGSGEPPSAPAHLLGLVNGAALALSWTPTYAGGEPTAMFLAVQGPVSGIVPLGLEETFEFAGVPAGTYTFQVIATNAAGASAPSNAITLTFPAACTGVPGPPLRLIAERSGRVLTVSWEAPVTGAAVTSYRLFVGAPGDVAPSAARTPGPAYGFSVPLRVRQVSGAVSPSWYTFTVQAENACGAGAMSAPVTIVVP